MNKKIAILLVITLIFGGMMHYTQKTPVAKSESELIIYNIDVGQADCALVLCGDKSMLIDGGNVSDSSLIYSFLKEHQINHLDYIIATHPHEDHVGGLSGALNFATVEKVYCPVKEYDSKAFKDFVKYLNVQEKEITIPEPGEIFMLGDATIQIIGPLKKYSDINNFSIVLRITFNNTSFLFTGDIERDAELDIIDSGYDLKSNVLKVSHHGSSSSSTYPFLYYVMPEYAVISCGKNNAYSHPDEATLSKFKDLSAKIYRTDLHGTITCISDGVNIIFKTTKAPENDS